MSAPLSLRYSSRAVQLVLLAAMVACGAETTTSLPPVATPDPASRLVVQSFSIIEFQYPSAPGFWFYAPQLHIRETGNGKGAILKGLKFIIPGLDAAPPCNAALSVGAGGDVVLFNEIYGDYQYTLSEGALRAGGGDATVIMTVTDGRGANVSVVATGPIVAGALPTTYTGGNPLFQCM